MRQMQLYVINIVLNQLTSKPVAFLALIVLVTGCFDSSADCKQVDSSTVAGICYGSLPDPGAEASYVAPDFRQTLSTPSTGLFFTRLTNNSERIAKDAPVLIHHYSRRQAWNKNETLIDLTEAIVDASSFEPIVQPVSLSSGRNWTNTYSDQMIGIQYNPDPNELVRFNVKTQRATLIHRFTEYKQCSLGQGEGNLSDDDNRIVLTCRKEPDGIFDIIAFDINQGVVLGTITGKPNLNWASYSRSGEFIVVENNTFPDPNAELIRYNADLSNPVPLLSKPEHGDFALDSEGNDVYAVLNADNVSYIRLADRLKVTLNIGRSKESMHGHISCRSSALPNRCYISTYSNGHIGSVYLQQELPVKDELFPLDMKALKGPKVYMHWGYHHSTGNKYKSEAKATVNRSGDKILFTSNWGKSEIEPEEYIIQLEYP